MAIRLHDSLMVHPGPWLSRNVMSHYRLSVTEVAKHLSVTRAALSNLLNGNSALSPEMALRFEAAFGVSARTLLNMQANHDLTKARKADLGVERLEVAYA